MGKLLKAMATAFETIAEASANWQSTVERASTTVKHDATYGDVVRAVSKSTNDGFWKNRMLNIIPDDADSSKYDAAIAILEDNQDDFWTAKALERVFKRP